MKLRPAKMTKFKLLQLLLTFAIVMRACHSIRINQIPVLEVDRSKHKPIHVLKIKIDMDDKIIVHRSN